MYSKHLWNLERNPLSVTSLCCHLLHGLLKHRAVSVYWVCAAAVYMVVCSEAARNFPCVQPGQCKPASRRTYWWPRLGSSSALEAPLGNQSQEWRKKPWTIAAIEYTGENIQQKQSCRHRGQWRGRGRRCFRHWSRVSPTAQGGADCHSAAHRDPL